MPLIRMLSQPRLSALAVTTRQTRRAAIHDDRRLRIALAAHRRAGRVAVGGVGGGCGGVRGG